MTSKRQISMGSQSRAQALARCLEEGGERKQDEAIGFKKALF